MTKFEYSTVVPSGMVGFVSTYTYGVERARDSSSLEALKEENARLMSLQLELGCVLVSSELPEDLENKVLEMREEFRNDPRAAGYLSELRDISSVDFGTAIEALKSGKVVTRVIWEGMSMGLALQFGTIEPPYIYMRKLDGDVNAGSKLPWLASHSDILSEDWVILD